MRPVSLAALLLFVTASCDQSLGPADSPSLPESPAPSEAQLLRAHIDGRDYIVRPAGFDTAAIEVGKGGIRLSAQIASGASLDAAAGPGVFQLRVAGTPEGGDFPGRVLFTRYDDFSGALYWIAPGQSFDLYVGLWHVKENHWDVAPTAIRVTRRHTGSVVPD